MSLCRPTKIPDFTLRVTSASVVGLPPRDLAGLGAAVQTMIRSSLEKVFFFMHFQILLSLANA